VDEPLTAARGARPRVPEPTAGKMNRAVETLNNVGRLGRHRDWRPRRPYGVPPVFTRWVTASPPRKE